VEATLKIAVAGGDSRSESYPWGKDIEVVCYQGDKYGGNGEVKKLANALAADKFDVVITLTRWMGHAMYDVIKQNARCRVITWDRGIGELVRQLPELLAGRQS
jgi:hypothetical protein